MSAKRLPGEPTPLRATDYMGSDMLDTDEPATSFYGRLGRCYELAGYAVMLGELSDGTLVHGSYWGPGGFRRIGHAWVLTGDDNSQVWEPITGKTYDAEEWYDWTNAEDERTYTAGEASKAAVAAQHWGRWHESEYP